MPQPPGKRLAHPPCVESVEDLELALCEVGWCQAAAAAEDAKLDAELQAARLKSDEARQIRVGRTSTTLVERTLSLNIAIRQFAESNPEAVQADGKKSRKFVHGEVGFRQKRGGIEPAEGESAGSVLDRLDGLSKLLERIADFLATLALRIRGKRRVSAAALGLSLKPSIKLSRIAESLEQGSLTEKDLDALGLVRRPPRDEVYVTPVEYRPDLPDAAAE